MSGTEPTGAAAAVEETGAASVEDGAGVETAGLAAAEDTLDAVGFAAADADAEVLEAGAGALGTVSGWDMGVS